MESENIDRIAEAVKIAVRAALTPEDKEEDKEEPKIPEIGAKEKTAGYAKGVASIMDQLNEIYHPTSHDFMACKTCRPLFEDKIKGMGYDVVDNEGKITIIPKKSK